MPRPLSEKTFAPAISSPLNPDSPCQTPSSTGPRRTQALPARVARRPNNALDSPTQHLLRKKAAAAWRCEVLHQALAAPPGPHGAPAQELDGLRVNDIAITIELMSVHGDMGLEFGLAIGPRSAAGRGPHHGRSDARAGRVVANQPGVPESDCWPHRRTTNRVTRRAMLVLASLCLLCFLHAVRIAHDFSLRSTLKT